MRLWQHLLKQQAAPAVGPAYRYWRIRVTGVVGVGSILLIHEIELRSAYGGADLTTPSTPTAQSSSSNVTTRANKLVDNTTGTHWAAATATLPQWARLDMGSPVSIAQVAMYADISSRAPSAFVIQGSDDGANFTDVKAFTGVTGWTAAWRTFDL